jgi:hypothetical protein
MLLGIVVLAFAAWAPALPCPSCIDLGCAVFRCDICGGQGGPRAARRMSLWKRWTAIQALEREGNRKLRLLP